jgi:hypothetical protein
VSVKEHLLFPMTGFRTRFPAVTPEGRVLLPGHVMISSMFRAVLKRHQEVAGSTWPRGFTPSIGGNVTFI